jgi:alpha-ketoglutarate-dependent taurine dioxygenase
MPPWSWSNKALDTWKVVFFRDQDLDHASQIAFGRRFGGLTYARPNDNAPPKGTRRSIRSMIAAFRLSSAPIPRNVVRRPGR